MYFIFGFPKMTLKTEIARYWLRNYTSPASGNYINGCHQIEKGISHKTERLFWWKIATYYRYKPFSSTTFMLTQVWSVKLLLCSIIYGNNWYDEMSVCLYFDIVYLPFVASCWFSSKAAKHHVILQLVYTTIHQLVHSTPISPYTLIGLSPNLVYRRASGCQPQYYTPYS